MDTGSSYIKLNPCFGNWWAFARGGVKVGIGGGVRGLGVLGFGGFGALSVLLLISSGFGLHMHGA